MPRLKSKPSCSMLLPANLEPSAQASPRLKLNLRLLHGDIVALGPGKAELLEKIAKYGSISQAGREMDMSYRRAWVLVDEMNRCFRSPLVITSKGGAVGGGARLSSLGERVLDRYRKMTAAVGEAALTFVAGFEEFMAGSLAPPQEDE